MHSLYIFAFATVPRVVRSRVLEVEASLRRRLLGVGWKPSCAHADPRCRQNSRQMHTNVVFSSRLAGFLAGAGGGAMVYPLEYSLVRACLLDIRASSAQGV